MCRVCCFVLCCYGEVTWSESQNTRHHFYQLLSGVLQVERCWKRGCRGIPAVSSSLEGDVPDPWHTNQPKGVTESLLLELLELRGSLNSSHHNIPYHAFLAPRPRSYHERRHLIKILYGCMMHLLKIYTLCPTLCNRVHIIIYIRRCKMNHLFIKYISFWIICFRMVSTPYLFFDKICSLYLVFL